MSELDTTTDTADQRIRADMVSLYLDPARNQVEQLPADSLVDSPFQPRLTYDEAALAALADTIRAVGVMQPILVRPLSVDAAIAFNRANPARAGEHQGLYEIVYGHRRTRGARLAEVGTVPAIVRDLTDAQVLQLQSIENVQRQNLKPLEEAAAYAHYLKAHGVNKDQLAKEIGLSRTHVYNRLRLLGLVDSVKQALAEGEVDIDVAGAIARLHSPKIQEKALAAIKGKYLDMDDGGKRSVRRIRELLAEKFTLKLSEALFDRDDAGLLAAAGACTTCPKRSANAPEYQDLTEAKAITHYSSNRAGPNLCTDPECFDAKKTAHLARKASELQAKGKTVVTGNKARALVGADGSLKEGYIALKDVKAELAKSAKGSQAPAVMPVIIQNPRDGKTIEAVKVEDLKAAGVKVKAPTNRSAGNHQAARQKYEQERREKQAEADRQTRVHVSVLGAVRRKAAGVPLSTVALQLVAATALKAVSYDERGLLATMHGFKDCDALKKGIGSMPPDRLTTLLLDCALLDDVIANPYHALKPEPLLAAAKHYGVDVAAIRREVEKLPEDTKTIDLLNAGAADATPPDPAGAAPAAVSTASAPKATKKAGKAASKAQASPAPEKAADEARDDAPAINAAQAAWPFPPRQRIERRAQA